MFLIEVLYYIFFLSTDENAALVETQVSNVITSCKVKNLTNVSILNKSPQTL